AAVRGGGCAGVVTRRRRGGAPHAAAGDTAAPRSTVSLDDAGDTPILREYRAVKERHPDAIALARLGHFFELFGEDAERAAPILGVEPRGHQNATTSDSGSACAES